MTLPQGWILRASRSKGKVYYYNTLTKEARWTRPTDEPNSVGEAPANDKKRKFAETTSTLTPEDARRAAIFRCMRVGASSGSKAFSPWDHQVDAVDKLLEALAEPGDGERANRFLLQHSTGSGKTVTIGALTHQLLYFQDSRGQRFHTVVLLIDRIKLDEQVGDSVEKFLRRNGVDCVHRVSSVEHLVTLLTSSEPSPQRVIITTIQKIGHLAKNKVLLTRLLQGVNSSSNNCDPVHSRIAIITDEAHRSHTTATRQTIESVMKAGDEAVEGGSSVTFVGFTATPNIEALQLFGSKSSSKPGALVPFHCYTMSRAVADGRIVDVLLNYVSVRCKLEVSIPLSVQHQLVKSNLMRSVMDAASNDVEVLKAKSAFIMNDFQQMKEVWTRAKCMVVTRSRRDVVRYYEVITAFVKNMRLPWRSFAVFSGNITTHSADNDASGSTRNVTEQSLNQRDVTLLNSDIVIVCDKLDTGYSDPLLACMYIDRYLRSSVQTVQLLSRLNRKHPNKGEVRVVDFANHVALIRRHFGIFWEESATTENAEEKLCYADYRTMATIVSSFIPPWEVNLDDDSVVRKRLTDLVLTLDRDAFQQVMEGVRVGREVWDAFENEHKGITPAWRYSDIMQLKSFVEQAVTPSEDTSLNTEEIVAKMKTRVQEYEVQYRGKIDPGFLLEASPSLCAVTTPGAIGDSLRIFDVLLELLPWASRAISNEALYLFIRGAVEETTAPAERSRFQDLTCSLTAKIATLLNC